MRIVDEMGRDVEAPDLSAGTLSPTIVVRKGAVPPDDVEKFAWADDDYEEAMLYAVPTPEEAAMAVETAPTRLADLEASTDDMLLLLADTIGGAL